MLSWQSVKNSMLIQVTSLYKLLFPSIFVIVKFLMKLSASISICTIAVYGIHSLCACTNICVSMYFMTVHVQAITMHSNQLYSYTTPLAQLATDDRHRYTDTYTDISTHGITCYLVGSHFNQLSYTNPISTCSQA